MEENKNSEENELQQEHFFFISYLARFHLIVQGLIKAEIEEMVHYIPLDNVTFTHLNINYKQPVSEVRKVLPKQKNGNKKEKIKNNKN